MVVLMLGFARPRANIDSKARSQPLERCCDPLERRQPCLQTLDQGGSLVLK
jgi:hypothetical protein